MATLLKRADGAIGEIAKLVGARITTKQSIRQHHSDGGLPLHEPQMPDAVVFPDSTEEVAEIVKICALHKVPVIAYGTGTSLEGQVNAPHGGICLDLANMNEVLAVHAEDLDVVLQPCVTRKQLNEYLRDTGLFFPIDPGADASLGGMAATRASGTNAVRYGTMKDNVLALKVVLGDGRVVTTGRRARKSAAGYDLTRLFVGSEGTLGIITELTLRLYGIPEAITAAVCPFESIEGAVNAVIETIQLGVPVARIELLDTLMMQAINQYSKVDYPESPTLFLEFHGTVASAAEQAEMVAEIVAGHGGGPFRWAAKTEDRNKLWDARHQAAYAAQALRPGGRVLSTDVCVPISRLAECILETYADLEATDLIAPLVGHAGDGNFHLAIVYDPEDHDEVAAVERVYERLIMRALAMEGTCTGEHGIGLGKKRFLETELGEAVAVMRSIKLALDPDNIMNPGKIFTI